MLARLDTLLGPMFEKYPVKAIGVSCGGPLDSERGIIMSPPNLPGWDNVCITEYLSKKYGVPAKLQNDANACAWAEYKFGAGKGCRNMVFCTMGTGFGAGLVLGGKLYSGTSDLAGEIGHIRLAEHGPVGFGKRGSVEGFCSGGGIAQLGKIAALEKLQAGQKTAYCSSLAELETVTAKTIGDAAENGDETATEVYRECGRYLGKALSILIDLLNPQFIVIGSIFVRSENLIRASMQEVIDAECLPVAAAACKVVPAKLGESLGDIAALSVAML
jgi:glucokinase